MKKILFLIIPILLLTTGCDTDMGASYSTYCDEKYGIEYIKMSGGYQGGLTVRLDSNGNVIHCKRDD